MAQEQMPFNITGSGERTRVITNVVNGWNQCTATSVGNLVGLFV